MARQKVEIPEVLQPFKKAVLDNWNAHDKAKRDHIRHNGYPKDGSREEKSEYSRWAHKLDDEIERDNERNIDKLISNLIERAEKKGGRIVSYNSLVFSNGNLGEGGVAINGYIETETGRVEVRSIIAGGYNIQRLHVRVLVK